MNLENYDKIEHDDGRIELIPKKKDADWIPRENQSYFFVCALGGVLEQGWRETIQDDERMANYNVYPSRELAEKAAKFMRRSNAIIRACLLVEPEMDVSGPCYRYVPIRLSDVWRNYYCFGYNVGCKEINKAIEAADLLKKWGVE